MMSSVLLNCNSLTEKAVYIICTTVLLSLCVLCVLTIAVVVIICCCKCCQKRAERQNYLSEVERLRICCEKDCCKPCDGKTGTGCTFLTEVKNGKSVTIECEQTPTGMKCKIDFK